MLKADDYRVDTKEVNGLTINVTSYRIGETYYCHVANTDPGAVIARSQGGSQDEAIRAAMAKATERIKPRASS